MIETKNLVMKEYNEKYIEKVHLNFLSSSKTAKYVLWRPTGNVLEAKSKIEYWLNGVNNIVFYLIHKKDNDEPIGFVYVEELEPGIYGNLGIAIGENYVSKGHGSEVLNALIEYLKSIGGKEIHYSHFKENEASKALALKFGFEYYKQSKRTRRYDNKEFEELFYVLKLDK